MYFASVMLSLMTCDSPQLTTAHWAAARPKAGADTWTSTLPPMLAYTFCKSTTELDVLHRKQRMHSASAAGKNIQQNPAWSLSKHHSDLDKMAEAFRGKGIHLGSTGLQGQGDVLPGLPKAGPAHLHLNRLRL